MKFDKHLPIQQLMPYVKHYVISENESGSEYTVFPTSGMVIGFQYKGRLATVSGSTESALASAGITGIADSYKTFKSQPQTGTVLVYFTELGFSHFGSVPPDELFNLSIPLADLFGQDGIERVEDRLSMATTDRQRIQVVEQFLLAQLNDRADDKLITEAVRLIFQSGGNIRIKDLNQKLFISQSPLEKRFRKSVGTSPKKFASIVRLNGIMETFGKAGSLTQISYEHQFFDQAHFSKAFKRFTGITPEQFKRSI